LYFFDEASIFFKEIIRNNDGIYSGRYPGQVLKKTRKICGSLPFTAYTFLNRKVSSHSEISYIIGNKPDGSMSSRFFIIAGLLPVTAFCGAARFRRSGLIQPAH